MKKDSILYVVLFTFVVCAAFVFPLAVANELTKPAVAANRQFTVQAAVLGALGVDYADRDEAGRRFADIVEPMAGSSPPAFVARVDGAEFVVVEETGPGLWGGITVMLAADPAGSRVRGVRIVSQNETPGLGGRIEEPWFLAQFENEAAGSGVRVAVGAESSGTGDADPANGRVDGITGASRSSQAFGDIVNAALVRVRAVAGGSK